MDIAGAGGGLREQPVASGARGFLQSGFGFSAAPTQNAMSDAEAAGQTFHRGRFARRFGAQAMVDRHRNELWAAVEPLRPARREYEERRRLRSCGNGSVRARVALGVAA